MTAVQSVDHAALAPVYVLAAVAVLVLVVDLVRPGLRGSLLALAALGPVGAVVAVVSQGSTRRGTFCVPSAGDLAPSCSFTVDGGTRVLAAAFCLLALVAIALSATMLRDVPPGEYAFLLLCSLTGGVVLVSSRDVLTLIVAVETLTLPTYVLVGLRRSVAAAEAAVTYFVVSVVSTAVTLLGAGLLYAVTGAVHLDRIAALLPAARSLPLTSVAAVLVLVGLLFKLAAVPFHAWAPATYDGAPVPIAGYLATASKFGGAIAVVLVATVALRPVSDVVGPVLAVVAAVTMTVGNLVALRQRRLVRLLAWSSVAQAGYLLAPLAVPDVAGTIGFLLLYVLVNAGAFAAVAALRGPFDGGTLDDLRGAWQRSRWATVGLVVALAGLAGLPPGLAGLFAKVVVVRSLLDGSAGWLALIVAVNAVIGLAYYLRVAVTCFAPLVGPADHPTWPADARIAPAPVRLGVVTLTVVAAVVAGVWPQPLLDAAQTVADSLR